MSEPSAPDPIQAVRDAIAEATSAPLPPFTPDQLGAAITEYLADDDNPAGQVLAAAVTYLAAQMSRLVDQRQSALAGIDHLARQLEHPPLTSTERALLTEAVDTFFDDFTNLPDAWAALRSRLVELELVIADGTRVDTE